MSVATHYRMRAGGVTKQFALLLTAQVCSALLQAVSVLLLARWTGPTQFGQFAATLASLGIVVALGDLGFATLATRRRARDPEDPTIGRLLGVGKMLSLFVGLLTLVVLVVASPGNFESFTLLSLAGYTILDRWLQIELGISIADSRVWVNLVCLTMARGMLLVGMLVGKSVMGLSPVVAYSTSAFAASLVAYATAKGLTARYAPIRSWVGFVEDLRESIAFWVATVSAMVRTLDVVVLALVASSTSAGIYAVPGRVSAPLRLLPLTINRMAVPYGSRGDRAAVVALKRVMRFILIAMLILYGAMFIFADRLIDTLVGSQYGAAVVPMQIILVGLMFNISGSFKSGLLQGAGHQRVVAQLGVVLAATCLSLVAVLGAIWGATGAAAAVTSVYVMQYVATTLIYSSLERRQAI